MGFRMLTGGVNDGSGVLARLSEIAPGAIDRDEVVDERYGRNRKEQFAGVRHILRLLDHLDGSSAIEQLASALGHDGQQFGLHQFLQALGRRLGDHQ